jgi:hypothetical protein
MNVGWLARLGGVALALGLIYGGLDLAGATGPPSNVTGIVTVGNGASNPVPVQQQGTATVNVSNSSVPVTGTVKIDPTGNTVQLGGTATVHTQAADNPAFTPVHLNQAVNFAAGEALESETPYVVPDGKELVIQQVSFEGHLPSGENIIQMTITTGDGPTWFPVQSDEPAGANDWITGGGPATIYAGPGSFVAVELGRFPSNDTGSIGVAENGYLVNLP